MKEVVTLGLGHIFKAESVSCSDGTDMWHKKETRAVHDGKRTRSVRGGVSLAKQSDSP